MPSSIGPSAIEGYPTNLTHAPPMPSDAESRGGGWGGVTIGQAEASIGLPPRALRIPPYHCCRPAFRQVGDYIICQCFGAPASAGFSLIT